MDNEVRKGVMKELMKQMLLGLTQDIEQGKKDNQEARKMQDFTVEKMSVEIAFLNRRPELGWINEGIEHYVNLGARISRNDILTRLVEKMVEFQEVKDPKKITGILKEFREHEKETLDLVRPHILKPRF